MKNKLNIAILIMSIIATVLSTIAITRQGHTYKTIKDTRKELGGLRSDLKFFEMNLEQINNNDIELMGIMDKKINENNEKLVNIMDIKINQNSSAMAELIGDLLVSIKSNISKIEGRVKTLESSGR